MGKIKIQGLMSPAPLVIFALILIAGCKSIEVESNWVPQPMIVDGWMDDWEGLPGTYFEESGVSLGISHNAENLYLLFRFRDPSWARAIRMTGLTLWFDAGAGKNKDLGVRYFGGPSMDELRKTMRQSDRMPNRMLPEQEERMKEDDSLSGNRLTIINKDWWYKEDLISADGSQGPAVAFARNQGFFIYEFAIPLVEVNSDNFGIKIQPGEKICIGAEWGGLPVRDGQSGGMESRIEGPGGIGGGRGGGMGGGRRGGPGGGIDGPPGARNRPPDKQEFWIKTFLAEYKDL